MDDVVHARLAAHPRVRLHLAAGVGHNVQGEAPKLVRDLVFEACRRAAAETLYDVRELDEPLAEATPLTARRVLHWGPGGSAFAGAVLAWNPTAEVSVLGEDADAVPEGTFHAVALGASPPPGLLARAVAVLAEGGHLVVRGPDAEPSLGAAGLHLREPVDDAGTGVLRAQKLPPGQSPQAALRYEMAAAAPFLMDVRTRLPARGLRTDPELSVVYTTPPFTPSPRPFDAPKVVVLQRPAPLTLEQGRQMMAHLIARGWLLVIEYDDHPGLVAEALGRELNQAQLERFGYAHAMQTTTEPLRALFAQFVPEVAVFENAVFELAHFPRQPRQPRVFYGAVGRAGFGAQVARALGPVIAKIPKVEFVVLGDPAVFEALPTTRKVLEPLLPYEAYLARMAGCAVSLSPIEARDLNAAKSDTKHLDAARAGVLTIASPTVYERTIRHGENGLIARELSDWAPLLTRALEDPAWRRGMARTAWDEVRTSRMFAGQVARRRDWLFGLWAQREALNASAFARIPGLAEAVAAERARMDKG